MYKYSPHSGFSANYNINEYISEPSICDNSTSRITWRLRNWNTSKEIHVASSTCCVEWKCSQYPVSKLLYSLKWTDRPHFVSSANGNINKVTRYLVLLVEFIDKPPIHSFKFNLDCSYGGNSENRRSGINEVCVSVGEDYRGKQFVLFDKAVPDTTWTVNPNGSYIEDAGERYIPAYADWDLSLSITVTPVQSSTQAIR